MIKLLKLVRLLVVGGVWGGAAWWAWSRYGDAVKDVVAPSPAPTAPDAPSPSPSPVVAAGTIEAITPEAG